MAANRCRLHSLGVRQGDCLDGSHKIAYVSPLRDGAQGALRWPARAELSAISSSPAACQASKVAASTHGAVGRE